MRARLLGEVKGECAPSPKGSGSAAATAAAFLLGWLVGLCVCVGWSVGSIESGPARERRSDHSPSSGHPSSDRSTDRTADPAS